MVIKTVRLTSKRQATLPVQLCEELGVKPGDEIILERQKTTDEITWLLKPKKKIQSRWFAHQVFQYWFQLFFRNVTDLIPHNEIKTI